MKFQDLTNAYRLLHPKLTVLVVTNNRDRTANVMAAAWAMPVSKDPTVVGVSIAPSRKTFSNIDREKEFVLSIPKMDQIEKVWKAGRLSGHDVENKVGEIGFEPVAMDEVKTPGIKGAAANMGCRLFSKPRVGDHHIICGEVTGAEMDESVYTPDGKFKPGSAELIFHLGGNEFITPAEKRKFMD